MNFRTLIELPPQSFTLTPSSRVLVLGSCFAENVGRCLCDALGGDQCAVNPFGVLYNPRSIAQALELLLLSEEDSLLRLEATLFEGRDGLWHSWLFSGNFSAIGREEALQNMQQSLAHARALVRGEGPLLLILTFGTDHFYRLKAGGMVVANCHKEVPQSFEECVDTVADMTELLHQTVARFLSACPLADVMFTVSPYRYRKYGFHASQLSKSRLLLTVDNLLQDAALPTLSDRTTSFCYFPAYEIVLDELRDYRFYNPDMLHPSSQAVEYIWERFREWCFAPEMAAHYQQRLKLLKQLNHRTSH